MSHSEHLDEFDRYIMKFSSFLPLNRDYDRVLELGPGHIPRLLPGRLINNLQYLGIEKSKAAFDDCQRLFKNEQIRFMNLDVSEYLPEEDFDLILDSRTMHCLSSYENWLRTLQNLASSLSDGGVFLGEMAVKSDQMDFSEPYFYDEQTCILYKDGKANRLILDSKMVEKAFQFCGLKIFYFTIPFGMKVIFDDSRDKIKTEDPDILRFVTVKDRSNRY